MPSFFFFFFLRRKFCVHKNGFLIYLGHGYLFSMNQVQGDTRDTVKPPGSPFWRTRCALTIDTSRGSVLSVHPVHRSGSGYPYWDAVLSVQAARRTGV